MKIHIKHMVSLRCKLVVKDTLKNLGIRYKCIDLGEVDIENNELSDKKKEELKKVLHQYGLELMDEKKSIIVERIKNILVEMIHYSDELPRIKISLFLSKKLNHKLIILKSQSTSFCDFVLINKNANTAIIPNVIIKVCDAITNDNTNRMADNIPNIKKFTDNPSL